MKNSYAIKLCLGLPVAFLLSAASSHAATLLLDFGVTVASGADLVNSPYHQTYGSEASSHTTWNTIANTAVSGTLLSADTAAPAATYQLVTGRVPLTGLTWDATPGTINGITGSTFNVYSTGVYAGNSIGRDGIFNAATSNPARPNVLGVVIDGLGAGTFEIFVIADNTNSIANTQLQTVTASAISSMNPATATVSDSSSADILNYGIGESADHTAADTSSWVFGVDYEVLTVTLGAEDKLLIYSMGFDGNGEARAFMNGIMINSVVPEPSTYAAIFGLVALGGAVARRRMKRAS